MLDDFVARCEHDLEVETVRIHRTLVTGHHSDVCGGEPQQDDETLACLLPAHGRPSRRDCDVARAHPAHARPPVSRLAQIDASPDVHRDDVVGRLHDGIELAKAMQFERQPVPPARPAGEQRIRDGARDHRRRRLRTHQLQVRRPLDRKRRCVDRDALACRGYHDFMAPPGRPMERQNICWPPLIAMFAPVRNAASSLARYATSPATSSGLPRRPIGICGMILLSRTSFGIAITILVPM